MKLLLTRRANWMQKDLEEMTPLHLTTRHKSPKCLALLLKFMAPGEVDTQDKNKVTDYQNGRQVEQKANTLFYDVKPQGRRLNYHSYMAEQFQISICPSKGFHLNCVLPATVV